ncbi:hypothetical protein Rhe02_13000 [Rhizocola hellebori]|uniref:Type I-E CRISPR-associated protein Cse1/CasA n=1 Tax=Rhizocola hellebori TaxID=1392758 RepID=A0A8J3Q4L5_9ACTN|nr:DUF6025 family protein [Rhizocola hellebori]GIH03233.1 hypothetical protein Rhe02_13000 [Rhizocola hellebori]
MTDVALFLEDAGLFSPEIIERLATKERYYAGVNPGDSNVQVGRLLDAVRHHEWLQPMRSGRIGNWASIWSGRSPLLAYNRAATADLGVARPVIHSLTRTETSDLSAGDTVYRPGSVYQSGVLQSLVLTSPLVGWQDLDPRLPRFVPWTWGRIGVGPVNLVHLHGEQTRLHAPVSVLDEGDLFWQHHALVRQWLTRLWDKAADESAGGDITWLFGRGVRRDASICPLRVRRDGSVFVQSADEGVTWEKIGEAELLTDRCLLPYQVVAQADIAETLVRRAPEVTPLLSTRLGKALIGYLGASSPGAAADPYSQPVPFAMLVEWGALNQGGFPPVRPGAFAGKGYQQLTRLTVTALAQANDLPALAYVMLPLAPLILMPSTAKPLDVAWLAPFFHRLGTLPDDATFDEAVAVFQQWDRADAVSGFYRGKFSGKTSVAPHGRGEVAAQTIEQVEVRALTLRQAGLAVATLFNAWSEN